MRAKWSTRAQSARSARSAAIRSAAVTAGQSTCASKVGSAHRAVLTRGCLPEILAAILLAVNAADQLRTYGLARPLLGLLSMLDPYGVPEEVITAVATLNHLAAHRFGAGLDPVDGQQALACLAWLIRLGLVEPVESTVDSSGTRRLIRMHPLVHDAIRDRSPDHEDRAFAAAAALVQVWPEPDEVDRAFAATLRANAAVLQRCQRSYPLDRGDGVYLRQESGVQPLASLMTRSLAQSGLVSFAIAHLEARVTRAGQLLGPDDVETVRLRGQLPALMADGGDLTGAATYAAGLLPDQVRVLGDADPATRRTREQLIRWHDGSDRARRERIDRRLAEEMRETGLWNTPVVRHYLCRSGEKPTQPVDLAAAYLELLADTPRVHLSPGPTFVSLAQNATFSERAAYELGRAHDPAGAADTLQRLLVQQLRRIREELGSSLRQAGDAAGAAAEYEALVSYEIQLFGADSPSFYRYSYWGRLGYWRARIGEVAGAVAAYERELAEILAWYGPVYSRQQSMAARWNLGFWRGQSGDAAGAVAEFERLLEIQLALFDEWDSEVKVTREQIARWQARADEPDPDPRRWAADIDEAFWKSVDSQYWRFRERRD